MEPQAMQVRDAMPGIEANKSFRQHPHVPDVLDNAVSPAQGTPSTAREAAERRLAGTGCTVAVPSDSVFSAITHGIVH